MPTVSQRLTLPEILCMLILRPSLAMAPSTWICRECTLKDDGNKPGPCLMCQGPHPKRRAVASVPAAAAAPPDDNYAKDNNNNDDDDNNNNVDLPCDNIDVVFPPEERLVIDIVGIASGGRGCKCREHNVCCGEVLNVDIVVRLCGKEILVPDGKANMRKETVITVNWVTNGFE
jgi:hypothetical protein